MDIEPLIMIAIGAFALAGLVKGTVGLGLPITAVGLLSQFTDPRIAVAMAIVPIMASNVWQVWRAGDPLGSLRRYRLVLATIASFTILSALFVNLASTDLLKLLVGLMVITFALVNLAVRPPPLADRHDRSAQAAAGTVSGVLTGLTGLGAAPLVVYLLARRVEKDDFVRAIGMMFLVSTLPLALGYWQAGLFTGPNALNSLFMVAPTLAGFAIGERIRRRIDTKRFRTAVLVLFLITGLNLLRGVLF